MMPAQIPSVTIVLMYSVYFFHSGFFLSNLTASLISFSNLWTAEPTSFTPCSLLAMAAFRMLSYSSGEIGFCLRSIMGFFNLLS